MLRQQKEQLFVVFIVALCPFFLCGLLLSKGVEGEVTRRNKANCAYCVRQACMNSYTKLNWASTGMKKPRYR